MIYTLTTNPAVDMNIQSSNPIEYSKVNRTFGAVYTANGKGLNVSYVLRHYGIESKVLGFFGGFTGKFIVSDYQDRLHFEVLPVWVKDNTRVNVFLNDSKGEFNFVNEGSFVSKEAQRKMLKLIKELPDIKVLSISGSLAKGINPSYYDEILKICVERNIKFILDISSQKLADLLRYKPYLIKPNDDEVRNIFSWDMNTESDIICSLKNLHKLGAQNILLTLGENGMYFYNGKSIYFAKAKPVKVLSSACAGDSSMAAFLSKYIHDENNIEEAMKLACATGANVVESAGIGSLEKVEEYKRYVEFFQVE